MIVQAMLIALLFAEPAAAPATAAPTPAATPAAPAVAPAPPDPIAEIDVLMERWKGKSVGEIQGRLGLTETIKEASNGKVIFWLTRAETVTCGVGQGGEMRCGALGGDACRLGVAVDKQGNITAWKAVGGPEACKKFVAALAKP